MHIAANGRPVANGTTKPRSQAPLQWRNTNLEVLRDQAAWGGRENYHIDGRGLSLEQNDLRLPRWRKRVNYIVQ